MATALPDQVIGILLYQVIPDQTWSNSSDQ